MIKSARSMAGLPWLAAMAFFMQALDATILNTALPSIAESLNRSPLTMQSAIISYTLTVAMLIPVSGWLADRWMRKNIRGRIFVSALGMILFLPSLFGVGNAGTLGMAVCFLMMFGLGWGFFDCNNMPILCQIVRPQLRATGYGFMNLVSISCGGFADWGFGALRDRHVPLNLIFGAFAGIALLSAVVVLLIKPRTDPASMSPPAGP